jgi:hypothetical protein
LGKRNSAVTSKAEPATSKIRVFTINITKGFGPRY